jgi:alpha-L-fucosidase 2
MAKPHLQMSYQSAGSLFLDFQHEVVPGSYQRSLDIETAIAKTSYRLLGWRDSISTNAVTLGGRNRAAG